MYSLLLQPTLIMAFRRLAGRLHLDYANDANSAALKIAYANEVLKTSGCLGVDKQLTNCFFLNNSDLSQCAGELLLLIACMKKQ
jgi:hypothetical protein